MKKDAAAATPSIADLLSSKTSVALALYHHFITAFGEVGSISLHPAKTMVGIANSYRRIAWVTAIGKNFIHVVFPFKQPYTDNLCFQKIAPVPGDAMQYNHHFRMLHTGDVNEEVMRFMKLAYEG